MMDRDADYDRHHLPRKACEAAGREGARLMGAFFAYHTRSDLLVRRLVLATPTAAPTATTAGAKRKAPHQHASRGSSTHGFAHDPTGGAGHETSDAQWAHLTDGRRAKTDEVATCGATFGCTLGIIVAYLEGRGIPAERAHVLRSIRTQLLPAAESLRYMRGVDAEHLALGMASCRVVQAQRSAMQEMAPANCPRIDHKYGHAGTAVGTTATLLAAFGVMCEVPNHCRHFVHDCSLGKALRCAEAALDNWKPAVVHLPEEHWEALGAERRALHRASLAVREAIEAALERRLDPTLSMTTQLTWARLAAFPSGKLVNEFTQTRLCDQIRRRELFGMSLDDLLAPPACTLATRAPRRMLQPGVLPLSEIPAATLMPSRGGGGSQGRGESFSDTHSYASSSWHTLSSNGSNFSHVSQDSLGGLAECFAAGTGVL